MCNLCIIPIVLMALMVLTLFVIGIVTAYALIVKGNDWFERAAGILIAVLLLTGVMGAICSYIQDAERTEKAQQTVEAPTQCPRCIILDDYTIEEVPYGE